MARIFTSYHNDQSEWQYKYLSEVTSCCWKLWGDVRYKSGSRKVQPSSSGSLIVRAVCVKKKTLYITYTSSP